MWEIRANTDSFIVQEEYPNIFEDSEIYRRNEWKPVQVWAKFIFKFHVNDFRVVLMLDRVGNDVAKSGTLLVLDTNNNVVLEISDVTEAHQLSSVYEAILYAKNGLSYVLHEDLSSGLLNP